MTQTSDTVTWLRKKLRPTAAVLFSASIIANTVLTIFFFGTFDVKAWVRSAGVTNHVGLVHGYSLINLYYPPLSTTILWIVGKFQNIGLYAGWEKNYPTAVQIGLTYIPIKLTILIFTYITATLIYLFLIRQKKDGF